MSPKNIALIACGGIALLAIGYVSGRSSDEPKAAPASVTNAPPASASASAKASASSVGSGAPSASASAGPANPMTDPDALRDLFARLEGERKSRPMLEPTSTSIFDLVQKKGGVEIEEELQVAAWEVGAKFCDKIRSTKDVHIVVCEYADEDSAIKGQKLATNGIKRREVLRNKATTCAVHQASELPAAAAQAARVKELFKGM